jgi:hypothetical protein
VQAVTNATAVTLLQTFFKNIAKGPYDPYLIAASCLYLAGKIEDDHLRLRDVMNVVHTTLKGGDAEPLGLEDEYYNLREAITQAELLLLRMVSFRIKFSHPHKYLLHYLKSLRDWVSVDVWQKYPIARTSWSLLQDFYHDPDVLRFEPAHVALACVALALQTYGISVPYVGDAAPLPWYTTLCETASKEKIWDIAVKIMDVYNKEAEFIEPLIQH